MKKIIRVVIFMVFFCLWPVVVYAVTLDGKFEEWSNYPYTTDPAGDGYDNEDLTEVGWYPDMEAKRLYMHLKRGSNNNKKWNSYVNSIVGEKNYHIEITSNPNNGKVWVGLYDGSNVLLWSGTGNWCDRSNVEFYIPLVGIIDTGGAGYSMDIYAFTYSDRAPNSGTITLSTISTYPFFTLIVFGLITLVAYVKCRKDRCYDLCHVCLGKSYRTFRQSKTEVF